MSKWLNQFLENMPGTHSDKSDNWNPKPDLSLLAPPSMSTFGKNLKNMSGAISDKSDNWNAKSDLSLLAPPTIGVLGENLENMPGAVSDKSDSWNSKPVSQPYDEYEERLAIVEVDGNQTPIEAHRIAYLDAFISILSTLAENDPHQDWLTQKLQVALATLEAQNLPSLN